MGCKFSFKRVFLVASLALAGLFGISSILVNKQIQENPIVEKAEAAIPSTITISITKKGWNTYNWSYDKGDWYTTHIYFYSSENVISIDTDPFNSNVYMSYQEITQHTADLIGGVGYATVSVPSGAKSFVVRGQNGTSKKLRTYPQIIPSEDTGLNLFTIDTDDGSNQQKGYWSRRSQPTISTVYVDRNSTAYTGTTLYCVLYRRGDYISSSTHYNYQQLGAAVLSFSSVCYGGTEYSDSVDISSITNYAKASYIAISYDNGGRYDSILTGTVALLPSTNNAMLLKASDSTWSNSIPERISLITDIRITESWYDDATDNYDTSKNTYPIQAKFQNTIGTDTYTQNLVTKAINGTNYGITTVPFGVTAVRLFSDKPWGDNQYTYDYSIPTPSNGRKYVVLKTTTNEHDLNTGKQSAEFLADPFRYTITYAGVAGTHSNPSSYVWGVGVSTLTSATRVGYTFGGYHYNSDYSDYDVTSISANDFGDITLYTEWTPTLHTITWYDEDGETELYVAHNVPYDSTPSYEGRTPTKTGYGFTGWSPEIHTVEGNDSYVAQYAKCPAVARIYINYTWGNSKGPFVGASFGPDNQPEAAHDDEGGIDADPSHFIPASADGDSTFVGTWSRVSDVAVPSSGQDSIYLTYFEGTDRWATYMGPSGTTGQTYSSWNGMKNGVLQDTSKTNFNNGYIYTISNFTGTADGSGREYQCKQGYSDAYDGNESRKVKWTEYSISCVGVFVHYNLNGGSLSDSATRSVDEEVQLNSSLTLPATPTRAGHTFMGWEASTNGILNRASTGFTVSQPMTFTAIWASNTIEVVGGTGVGDDSKVRLWVSYDNAGISDVASLMYNGYGCECRVWVHSGNGSDGEHHEVIRPTGTIYNTNENAGEYLTNCPRRFDYYDIPLKYFTNSWYLNIQRYNADGTWSENQTGQLQLSSSDAFAFKIIYVQKTWENVPGAYDITSGCSSSLLAAYGLSGMRTCNNNLMNGYGGYARWYNTFAQENSTIISGLSNYQIVDYVNLSNYASESDIINSVSASSKYEWVKWMYNGKVGPMPSPGLNNFNGNISYSEQNDMPIILIIVMSSISILSITALSILLVKKRKQQ